MNKLTKWIITFLVFGFGFTGYYNFFIAGGNFVLNKQVENAQNNMKFYLEHIDNKGFYSNDKIIKNAISGNKERLIKCKNYIEKDNLLKFIDKINIFNNDKQICSQSLFISTNVYIKSNTTKKELSFLYGCIMIEEDINKCFK